MSNPLCHWELVVSDVERAKRFYTAVFGWQYRAASPEYTMIETGTPPGGGMMQKPRAMPSPGLNTYFQVDSIDATMRTAVEAGAIPIVPKTEVPGMGWFAMFLDPDRIPIGIFEDNPNGSGKEEQP